jgi:hypothetical protein
LIALGIDNNISMPASRGIISIEKITKNSAEGKSFSLSKTI